MMKTLTIILPLTVLIIGSASVVAEEDEKPQGRQSRQDIIKQYDLNGDGKLDDAERRAARAEFQSRANQGERPQGRPEGRRTGVSREDMIKKYDKNNDGKLDDAERQAAREELMALRKERPEGRREGAPRGRGGMDREALIKEFDKDGDGKLSDTERQVAMATLRERYGSGPGRPPGRGSGPQSGNWEAMMKRYDKNGDGELDESERAALREDMRKRMEQRRPRPDSEEDSG